MKSAHFNYEDSKGNKYYGAVTLKNNGKTSISIDSRQYLRYNIIDAMNQIAKEIVDADFKHSAIVGDVRSDSAMEGLLPLLRTETESLRVQFLEETKKFAIRNHAWATGIRAEYKALGTNLSGSERERYYRLQKMIYSPSFPGTNLEKYSEDEVKKAQEHYETSLSKLAMHLNALGLKIDTLVIKTSHIDVNMNMVLTDGVRTVRAFTIIASGPIKRPHYRYLIK